MSSANTETTFAQWQQGRALNEAAILVRKSAHTAREAIHLVPRTDACRPAALRALDASNLAWDAMQLLLDAGAVVPEWEAVRQAREATESESLAALAALSDPESRDLLALLEQAQQIAERIDARRGRTVPGDIRLQPGESRGIDLAESVSTLALRVRLEAFGPAGRD